MPQLFSSVVRRIQSWIENNLKWGLRFYPPYLGAGIWVEHISEDWRSVTVKMPLRFYNKNYVGTHYGGSLYSMCDPFYMIMLMHNLGSDYIVWDKAASIEFKKPGRGTVRAEFELTEDEIRSIRDEADDGSKVEPTFSVEVLDEANDVIAVVEKTLHIRSC